MTAGWQREEEKKKKRSGIIQQVNTNHRIPAGPGASVGPSCPAAGQALQSREGGPAGSAGLSPRKLATTSAGPGWESLGFSPQAPDTHCHTSEESAAHFHRPGKEEASNQLGMWALWYWPRRNQIHPSGASPDSRGGPAELVKVGFLTHILNSPHSMGSKPSCR